MAKHKPIVLSEADIKEFLHLIPSDKEDLRLCWLWPLSLSDMGYGRFESECGRYYAHRVSFTIFKGEIPEGLQVLHNCPGGDNPACWRPEHLWVGTQRDNVRDAYAKGRMCSGERRSKIMREAFNPKTYRTWITSDGQRGEKNKQAKLTQVDVREIRKLAAGGLSQSQIAAQFPITRTTVGNILRGEIWSHLK